MPGEDGEEPLAYGLNPPGRGPRPRYSRQLLDETIVVWQPYYPARLTDEDAREIIENVLAFAGALLGMRRSSGERARTSSELDEIQS
jgi:hypothetical protein